MASMLFVDSLFTTAVARHRSRQNPSRAPIATRKPRPCPPARIPVIHTFAMHVRCQLAHGKLEGASILAQAKGLSRIESSHRAKVIFRTEKLGKSTRRRHLGPVYFTFVTSKEVDLHVPKPVTRLLGLRVGVRDRWKTINIPIPQTKNFRRLCSNGIPKIFLQEKSLALSRGRAERNKGLELPAVRTAPR